MLLKFINKFINNYINSEETMVINYGNPNTAVGL